VKHPHLVVLGLLTLFGGFLMCAGFVFVGGSIWYRHYREDYVEAPIAKTAYAPPVAVAQPATVAVPAGKRAMSIQIGSEQPPGGFLPGARVDIIGKVPHAENGDKLVTKVIVEDVMVLAAGGEPSKEVVTVAVTVDEAEQLAAAKERGPLTVVLRKPGE
jgi:Flp pilus assembly protein CpaB